MKSALKVCAILLLATGLVAQTSTAPKPKKPKPASAVLTAADVQSLKDAIAAQQAALAQQQQQIQQLRDELRSREQVVQQAQTTAADAANKADAAQAQSNKDQQAVTELKGDVTDLKSNVTSAVVSIQETQKSISEPPTAIHVKGITITPGGFLAAETVRRTRALAADINTPFNSLTMPGASQSTMGEFFGSGRQSRISMLAEGRLKSVKLSGYVESDFLVGGRDFEQQPEQQLHVAPAPGMGPGCFRQRMDLYRRTDVESGDGNQAWHRQPHRSAADDDRSAVHRRIQLGTAIWRALAEELQQ